MNVRFFQNHDVTDGQEKNRSDHGQKIEVEKSNIHNLFFSCPGTTQIMPLSASNAREEENNLSSHTTLCHNAPAMESGSNEGSPLFPLRDDEEEESKAHPQQFDFVSVLRHCDGTQDLAICIPNVLALLIMARRRYFRLQRLGRHWIDREQVVEPPLSR
jgi:hypothetical protein